MDLEFGTLEELYKRISTHFPVFKNNTNYEQVIKQAELGVNLC